MFLNDFLKLKYLKQKLVEKINAKEALMNEDIHIRDIFIYPRAHLFSFGESMFVSPRLIDSTVPRLIEQFAMLAKIANEVHQQCYCDLNGNKYILNKENVNKITRLLTNEFFLYTANPLPLESYVKLLEELEKTAKQLHPNVHLVLGTIPVLLNDGKIYNTALYVQGGEPIKMEIFCKARASGQDIKYIDSDLFSKTKEASPSEFVSRGEKYVISNKSLFTVKTTGGASYTQAIDICVDHLLHHSKSLINNALKSDNDRELIPKQIDHLLVSNTVDIDSKAMVAETITHIDPIRSKAEQTEEAFIEDLEEKLKKSTDLIIHKADDSFIVHNPPFGSSFQIVIAPERKLSGFKNDIFELVDARNDQVKSEVLNSLFENQMSERPSFDLFKNEDEINKILKTLFEKINAMITCNFLEITFDTHNYQLKLNIMLLMRDIKEKLFNLESAQGNTNLVYGHVLLKDLSFQLQQINDGLPNSLIKAIQNEIKTASEKIQIFIPKFKNE